MSRFLLLATLCLSACTYFNGDDRVLVTSTPAGAMILIDGQDSGQTTPSMVTLGGITGDDHTVTVRKRGYADESRQVYHYTTAYMARWIDGATDSVWGVWPLWWTLGDMLMPFGVRWRYVPHELHVQLYKPDEAPVTEAVESAAR